MTTTQDALDQYQQTQKIKRNKQKRAENKETIAKVKARIKSLEGKLASDTAYIESLRQNVGTIVTNWEAVHGEGNTAYDSETQAALDIAVAALQRAREAKKVVQTRLNQATSDLATLTKSQETLWNAYKQLTNGKITDKDQTPPGNEQNTKLTTTQDRGGYTFNAPMVKQASFASPRDNLQNLIANGYNISEGTKDDAFFFWKNGQGGRGTIQMDRQSYTEANLNANKAQFGNPAEFDDTLYGFKFHYNPGAVTMTWGAVDGVDPYFAASDKNPSVPVAQNLLQSYIDFSFYINRIEDYNYLTDTGLKAQIDRSQFGGLDPQQYLTVYRAAFDAINPYPVTVPNDELVQIYRRGTMYDIDWLFKVMHGGTGFVNYKSSLMGVTSDIGWLPYRVLELHLGGSLRYRARVAALKVDHIIFNSRMVPVLSKVTMTMARYYDGAITGKTGAQ